MYPGEGRYPVTQAPLVRFLLQAHLTPGCITGSRTRHYPLITQHPIVCGIRDVLEREIALTEVFLELQVKNFISLKAIKSMKIQLSCPLFIDALHAVYSEIFLSSRRLSEQIPRQSNN